MSLAIAAGCVAIVLGALRLVHGLGFSSGWSAGYRAGVLVDCDDDGGPDGDGGEPVTVVERRLKVVGGKEAA